MQRAYADAYRELHARHWWWRAREALVVDWLRVHTPPGGFGPILDIGCGDALFFPVLRAFGEPEGVEPDAGLLSAAGRTLGPIHVGPFDDSFRPNHRYGLVLALDVIEHVEDDAAFLRRASELLRPGGALLITVPAFPALWTHHDVLNAHRRRYRRPGLVDLVRAAGLDVTSSHYFFHWLAPAKLVQAGRERLFGVSREPPRTPSSALNRLLLVASRLEQRLLTPLSPPFGGSLLLAARRAG
jgi:SAM-dependent methyltransferase